MKLPWWKKAIFSLLAIALSLGLLELGLHVSGVRPVLYAEDPYVGFSGRVPLFVQQPGNETLETSPNKIRFFNPQQFSESKTPATYRIFCVGGSTTYGRPYNDATSFCGWLRELLPVADPTHDWEVINAGGISYASYRVAMVMEELIRYEPDLFIVYSGHNEFLERRTYSAVLDIPRSVRRLGAQLSRTRTYSALRSVLVRGRGDANAVQRDVLPAEVDALLDKSVGPAAYRRDDVLRPQVVDHYRFNLGRIVDIAHSVGSEIVLVTPASNLRDCSPFKAEPRAGMDVDQRRRLQELVGAAREAFNADQWVEALGWVDQAVEVDDRDAGLHYLRARALDALGRHDEARSAYARSRDEDVCPLRALSAMRDIPAEVARERDVPWVDFATVAEQNSRDGIPGEDLFLDHVHPTIEGNRLLALSLIEEMTLQGFLRPEPGWDGPALGNVIERVKRRVDRPTHGIALKNLAKVFTWAGKFEEARDLAARSIQEIPEDSEAHFILGVTLEWTDDLEKATLQYQRAIDLEPGYAQAHKNLGRVRHRQGRTVEAIKHYERALVIRPDYPRALSDLGTLLAESGRFEQAVVRLESVLELEPDNFEVHRTLGNVFITQGDAARAITHLEETVRLQPEYARAHNNLAFVLVGQGQLDRARTHYEQALSARPDYASAHDGLGDLLVRQGHAVEAAAHYERVLQLEPGNQGTREKLKSLR
jgi:tetratricopeptide (TPR) repeat protein